MYNGSVTGASAVFDGGVAVDNITIDGTELIYQWRFNIRCTGEINLDSDGVIRLKDAGTQIGNFANNSSNFHVNVSVQDKDFVNGNDGGSTITAMTLDMSSAGAATFNNDVTAFSDKRLKTDISNIENGLDKVMRIKVFTIKEMI